MKNISLLSLDLWKDNSIFYSFPKHAVAFVFFFFFPSIQVSLIMLLLIIVCNDSGLRKSRRRP